MRRWSCCLSSQLDLGSRLQVKVSSQHVHFLMWSILGWPAEPRAHLVNSTLVHMLVACQATCQVGYQKEFTSQIFLGSCIGVLLILLELPSGAHVDKIMLLWGSSACTLPQAG